MNVLDYVRRQLATLRRQVDSAVQGTTNEQFNWLPPGSSNSIAATFSHLLATEDFYIQTVLQGRPRLWDEADWAARTGLNAPPGRGQGWQEVREQVYELEPWLVYQAAVREATDQYLATLNDADLDREVNFIGGKRTVADVLCTLVVHTAAHAGDIATLKGVQGVKGLPF